MYDLVHDMKAIHGNLFGNLGDACKMQFHRHHSDFKKYSKMLLPVKEGEI